MNRGRWVVDMSDWLTSSSTAHWLDAWVIEPRWAIADAAAGCATEMGESVDTPASHTVLLMRADARGADASYGVAS